MKFNRLSLSKKTRIDPTVIEDVRFNKLRKHAGERLYGKGMCVWSPREAPLT